ncbi:MAG: DNA repair protein RadA [Acetobacteraceae bacterium]|nr:DNA repair protein RadA [Acetobacteraceae bacterium]
MPKPATRFTCTACGASFPKWTGQCSACGAWNTLTEELAPRPGPLGSGAAAVSGRPVPLVGLAGASAAPPRLASRIAELDRVLGGGFVPGSAVLVGGDPGIGKSTLLLQAAAAVARAGPRVLYLSGEESVDQIRLRAARLGLAEAPVSLASVSALRDLLATLEADPRPDFAVVDSIQTVWLEEAGPAPGTVAQVRACAAELVRAAKARGFALVLVGHVTKEGALAGPRVVEHLVDAVLYLEGDRGHAFRILRGVKNRFGATDEIGVFEMTARGLAEVPNPSALFLAERRGNVSGSAVFAGVEGTRPVLVEIQALASRRGGEGPARRAVVGWEAGRLALILAVLEARCGVSFADRDVFLNVAGGLKVSEPAADLAVAAALVSALADRPTEADCVFFGEVGLSGEVRMVAQVEARLKEAAKLGFTTACLPKRVAGRGRAVAVPAGLRLREVGHVADLVSSLLASGQPTAGEGEARPARRSS